MNQHRLSALRLKLFACKVMLPQRTVERMLWAEDSFDAWDRLANEFGQWAKFDIKPVDRAPIEVVESAK